MALLKCSLAHHTHGPSHLEHMPAVLLAKEPHLLRSAVGEAVMIFLGLSTTALYGVLDGFPSACQHLGRSQRDPMTASPPS